MKKTRKYKKQKGGVSPSTPPIPSIPSIPYIPSIPSIPSINKPTFIDNAMGSIMATQVNPMIQKMIETQLCKCDQATLNLIGPEMDQVKIKVNQILSEFAGKINAFSVRLVMNMMKSIPFLGIFVAGIEEMVSGAITANNARLVYNRLMDYVHGISAKVQHLKDQMKTAENLTLPPLPSRVPTLKGGRRSTSRKHNKLLERAINSIKEFDETTHYPMHIHIRHNTKKRHK